MIGKIFEDEVDMAAMAGTKGRAIVGMRSLLMVISLSCMKVHFSGTIYRNLIGTGEYR
jgi:hypothetical protein